MNKLIITILSLLFFIISSCEEAEDTENLQTEITIISPYQNQEFIYAGQALEIITVIENKEAASAAYISVNNNIVASGLADTLIAYYEPNSNINQEINIEATLINNEGESITDNITMIINTIDQNTMSSEIVFMNVNEEFKIMRTPVTNRQFLNFLNSNEELNIEVVEIIWTNVDNDGNGDPEECDFDSNDNYEPKNWWYVTVTANYVNDNIPSGEYVVYRNANNKYDTNADYSGEAGRIQYDCETGLFYMPLEEDLTESIYLDHPVVGVSWIGANIYANYFGWTLPTIEQWMQAAKGENNEWTYPWNENIINQNYANYNNDNTSKVKYYNGLGELNLSLSAYGLYDMAGNVWEYTSHPSGTDAYYKIGGAFDSNSNQLNLLDLNEDGIPDAIGYALWEHVSNNTGFRCVTNTGYSSPPASGCTEENACNYDSFSESNTDCFQDDCLGLCDGNTQEFEFFQDLDGDGLGNPEVSEIQCNEPEEGWADNGNDIDDDCFSNNIDCNQICDGTAYYDGCNVCVGGDTGNEPCTEDCNGEEGGTADWDECGICSGGNTGHEANSDIDCNGDCFGTADWDECGICSGGNTGHEANSDLDECGVCFGNGKQYYCTGTNAGFGQTGYGCCDCNSLENDWEDCSIDIDVQYVCENEIEEPYEEVIFGCANENASNYYCDQADNQCVPIAPGSSIVKPPCNLINDGCIIYGCPDDGNCIAEEDCNGYQSPNPGIPADNFELEYSSNLNDDFGPTTCSDSSVYDCCEYTSPVFINIGETTDNSMEILINTPHDIGGFQFNVSEATITEGTGGASQIAGFTVSTGGSTVLGFSLTGGVIPAGTDTTLVNLSGTFPNSCLELGVISDGTGLALPLYFNEDDCGE